MVPAAVWTGILWTLAAQPSLPQPGLLDDLPFADKLEHLAAYAVLGLLLAAGASHAWGWSRQHTRFALLMMVVIVVAAIDETIQSLVPQRMADSADLIADAIGGMVGMVVGGYRLRAPPTLRGAGPTGRRTSRIRSAGEDETDG